MKFPENKTRLWDLKDQGDWSTARDGERVRVMNRSH